MTSQTDPVQAALDAAAVPTLERIRADRAKKEIPDKFKDFLWHLEQDPFSEDLSVKSLRAKAGIRDKSWEKKFCDLLGWQPLQYIRRRQAETGERLIRVLRFEVGDAAALVGLPDRKTFGRHYEAMFGEKPSEGLARPLGPLADQAVYRRLLRGELEPEERRWLKALLFDPYPDEDEEEVEASTPSPMPSVLDVPGRERRRADELWEAIRELPFKEQVARMNDHLFGTTALFDLLRRKSREEGRRDRQRGIQVAKLALASLHRCAEYWTERRHDLRALGLACLANARRLALDFTGAEADFVDCWAEWNRPRTRTDPLVLAEICFLHGNLRMSERRYEEALDFLTRSITLARREDERRIQALALIQRAAVKGYIERLGGASNDLDEARLLTAGTNNVFLSFNVQFNLTVLQLRQGKYRSARRSLKELKALRQSDIYQARQGEVEHLEGNINECMGDFALAEERYRSAHQHFIELQDWRQAALVALDLAALYARQDKQSEVLDLVSGLLPALESLNLYPETLSAVRLLRQGLRKMEITQALLAAVREKLQQDPLFHLS